MKKMDLEYLKCYDHEKIDMKVCNLQIFDCTRYPDTLDPMQEYSREEPIEEKEILGIKQNSENVKDEMLEL